MRLAKAFAANDVEVLLFSAHYKEDDPLVPDYFEKTTHLSRAVTDLHAFSNKRKLPLIDDILKNLYQASDADYFIYTNNDIILQKHFYTEVKKYIDTGKDAFIINRRRVKDTYKTVEELPLILADKGKKHPGFDCFVFKRELTSKMLLGNICIGVPFIGVTLAHNLFCFAQNFMLYDNVYLTAHIGLRIMSKRDDYYWYNRRQFNSIIKVLKPHLNIRKFPYAEKPFFIRYIKWGLNPSLFVFMNMKLEMNYPKAH